MQYYDIVGICWYPTECTTHMQYIDTVKGHIVNYRIMHDDIGWNMKTSCNDDIIFHMMIVVSNVDLFYLKMATHT